MCESRARERKRRGGAAAPPAPTRVVVSSLYQGAGADLRGLDGAAEVEEVGWLAAVQLDDVHRRHGEACRARGVRRVGPRPRLRRRRFVRARFA